MKNRVKEVLFRSTLRRLIHRNQCLRVNRTRRCKGGLDLLLLDHLQIETNLREEAKITLADMEIGVVENLSFKDMVSLKTINFTVDKRNYRQTVRRIQQEKKKQNK